jgi:hypothetical protein
MPVPGRGGMDLALLGRLKPTLRSSSKISWVRIATSRVKKRTGWDGPRALLGRLTSFASNPLCDLLRRSRGFESRPLRFK